LKETNKQTGGFSMAGVQIAERDRNFKEVVEETIWLVDSQASRVQKFWPDDTAIADFLATVSAHIFALSVKKLGPQSTREMLDRQLGEIRPVN
jgi:hypothetical protein